MAAHASYTEWNNYVATSWNALIVISLICLQSDVCRTISESNGDRYGVNRTPRIFPNLIAHNENFWHNFFLKCLFFFKGDAQKYNTQNFRA